MRIQHVILSAIAVAIVGLPVSRFADGAEPDHDRARRAVQSGEILPLSKVLSAVEDEFEGVLLEVELEREHERFVYEIELLTPQGHVIEITLDARDAKILEIEGQGVEAARKKR